METGTQKKPEPLTRPSTNLRVNQICISGLDTAHWKFAITTEENFQYQWMLIQQIWYTQVKNQKNMAWTNNLKEIITCIGLTVSQDINSNQK